ncbi:ribosomal RNA large subunit methyltransferase F-like protein [Hyaloraphidium curvatum]|nr:ribosomal RNA large subunit methyltransferase F-like protein [Hyaloraphidium curvatum]
MEASSAAPGAPDFADLARRYPSLAPYVRKDRQGAPHIEFSDPRALRELCYALMWLDHGIRIEFPLDSLIPTVPGRLEYVQWIGGLLAGNDRRAESRKEQSPVWGIDIGVGCSCIYPLLGCATNPSWNFFGTDIDDRSIEYAQDNVRRNQLDQRITLKLNTSRDILPPEILPDAVAAFDFVLCNPPFYSGPADFVPKAAAAPGTNTAGTHEAITGGGEIAFVLRMVEESKRLRGRVRWWTSLIGKKQTLDKLISVLKEEEGIKHSIGQFRPGQTSRWAVAWSVQ